MNLSLQLQISCTINDFLKCISLFSYYVKIILLIEMQHNHDIYLVILFSMKSHATLHSRTYIYFFIYNFEKKGHTK
jgi:hypothetical protein